MTLPTFLVIGAAKSGTTSLHSYLDLHPRVAMSEPKEPSFFNREDWEIRRDWYESLFDPAAEVRGESSTAYTRYPIVRGAPERIRALVPDAKLVYVVRDPIDRLVAHWVQSYATE